jgi:putative ABC transport system ATP-binding protein
MICEPAILLADEPTGSLDSVTGQDICRLLRQLCDEEATAMVVVTHDPAVATNADRIAIVKDGQLMTEIQADEFHDAPSLALRYQEVLSTPDVAEVV